MNTIMSAILPASNSTNNNVAHKQKLLANLLNAVKKCQNKYGGRTELATESDHSIVVLCHCFEAVLCHGLRHQPGSTLKQITELIGKSDNPSFWNFVESQLTSHEKERFAALRMVWTDRGRSRALIRACLNERSLERYFHCWLGHSSIDQYYEECAIMRDPEASAMLPNLAAGLVSILFAITIDSIDLNSTKDLNLEDLPRSEPIIAVPPPTIPKKSLGNHHVISFDDDEEVASISKIDIPKVSYSKNVLGENLNNTVERIDNGIDNKIIDDFNDEVPKQHCSVNSEDSQKKIELSFQNIDQETPIEHILNKHSNLSDSGMGETAFPIVESYGSSSSSIKGSTDSIESSSLEAYITILKSRLEEKEDRCNWLEARVEELSRENQQLKQLRNKTHTGPSFSISIPKVHKIGSHYEYEILISANYCNDSWKLLRRYNGFYNLHKELCKKNSSVNMLDFPPKKAIGSMSSVVLEERRQRLQAYLRQLIIILPQLACCKTKSQLERTVTFFRPEQET